MLYATALLVVVIAGAGPLQFSGTASVYSEYGWVTGDSLVRPRPELRFNVNPSLSLFGLPIGLDMLLSTQENPLRQQLDKFKLFLNPTKWLESQTNLSGLALSLKGIELGSCNPSWTPYTLSGAPVLGGAVELTPWYLYAAAAGGRSQRRVAVSDSTQGAYARMLYSGRFGFGKKEGTHFYLTAMYVGDDTVPPAGNWRPNPNDTADTYEVVRPQENYVLGAEFNLDLAKGAFRLESEVTGSELTRDKRLPVEHWDWLPGWVANTVKPRMSSSIDYAFKVKPALSVLSTKLYGKVEMVGPGFQSLGAPGLRNDNFVVGAGFSGSYLKNALAISVAYDNERDNLLRANATDGSDRVVRVLTVKSQTSRFTRWEASAGLTMPDLPYLQVGYYPYTQATDSLDSMAGVVSTSLTRGNMVSVSAGHSYQTGKVSHSPSFSVSYNDLHGATIGGNYTSWDASANYGLGFGFPLSLSAGGGYSRTTPDSGDLDTRISFDVTPSYTLSHTWMNSLSLGGTFGSGTRIDTRLTSSFPIWKICDASVSVIDAKYSGKDGKYNDVRLAAQLSKSW